MTTKQPRYAKRGLGRKMEKRVLSHFGLRPLRGVFIDIYDTGEKTITLGGKDFILFGDNEVQGRHNPMNGTHPGIRPRWAEVVAVSPQAYDEGFRVGQHVLCDTLKWTRKLYTRPDNGRQISWIPCADVLLVDEEKSAETIAALESTEPVKVVS